MKSIMKVICCLFICVCLFGCISEFSGKTTITEFDEYGKITKVTTTTDPIISQIVESTKDKTCFFFRENFVVGLIASPFSEATNSVFSIQAIYAHKKIGFLSIAEKHNVKDTIVNFPSIIATMNDMKDVSISGTGIDSKELNK